MVNPIDIIKAGAEALGRTCRAEAGPDWDVFYRAFAPGEVCITLADASMMSSSPGGPDWEIDWRGVAALAAHMQSQCQRAGWIIQCYPGSVMATRRNPLEKPHTHRHIVDYEPGDTDEQTTLNRSLAIVELLTPICARLRGEA